MPTDTPRPLPSFAEPPLRGPCPHDRVTIAGGRMVCRRAECGQDVTDWVRRQAAHERATGQVDARDP